MICDLLSSQSSSSEDTGKLINEIEESGEALPEAVLSIDGFEVAVPDDDWLCAKRRARTATSEAMVEWAEAAPWGIMMIEDEASEPSDPSER
jgi:hypothetical protein